jgi:Arc-like DNA binding domain
MRYGGLLENAVVARKKTDTVQLSKIRLREDLRRKLARDAERHHTTLNGEIVARLERSYVLEEQRQRENALVDLLLGSGENADFLRRLALRFQQYPAAANFLRMGVDHIWNEGVSTPSVDQMPFESTSALPPYSYEEEQ